MNKIIIKNPFIYIIVILSLVITVFILFTLPEMLVADEDYLKNHLEKAKNPPVEETANETIYLKGDILYCTGNSEAARNNNKAASLMVEGQYKKASEVLGYGMVRSPLFLPFRYNAGTCYLYLKNLDMALLHFTKALYLLPEYSKTYLQIGYIYDKRGVDKEAMNYFRQAIKKNPKELAAIIMMGNNYYKRNQVNMAEKFYRRSLEINPMFPDGLLGMAKIHFYRGEYFRAVIQIKSINTAGDYDKALHFYYAESAFKLKDYQTAYEQYEKLLTFRNDRFFLENSVSLIRHKMDLSKRFIDQMNY